MHFNTIAFITLLSLASAAPASLEARFPNSRGTRVLLPLVNSLYHGFNGSIDYGVRRGEVSRENWNGRDNGTLVTFDLNGRTLPERCNLDFYLEPNVQSSDPSAGSFASGTRLMDIFSSSQPAPVGGSKGWGGPGNQRDNHLGRVEVQNQDAKIVPTISSRLRGFPCPKIGDSNVKNGLVGYELVPVGDAVRVQWDTAVSGLYFNW
jgi:hypothetical protein